MGTNRIIESVLPLVICISAMLTCVVRYLAFVACANLGWEALQMPFYTLWQAGAPAAIAANVVVCTAIDTLIALGALTMAILLFRGSAWPAHGYSQIALAAGVFGIAYTIASERVNVEILSTWAYSEHMSVVPLVDVGVTPIIQWIVIPIAAFWWARPRRRTLV